MKYLPILLDISRTRITIFGGGKVASRKIEDLEGAELTVVAEKIDEKIEQKNIRVIRKKIEKEEDVIDYIAQADFVIIATSDRHINEMIKGVCERERKIYNLVDDRRSKAIFPSFHDENGIIIAVSTSGKAPSLARYIKNELSKNLKHYAMALDTVEKIRRSIDSHDEETRKRFFESLFSNEAFWDLVRNSRMEEAYDFAMNLWRERHVSDKP